LGLALSSAIHCNGLVPDPSASQIRFRWSFPNSLY
jgi:hypothetical protein